MTSLLMATSVSEVNRQAPCRTNKSPGVRLSECSRVADYHSVAVVDPTTVRALDVAIPAGGWFPQVSFLVSGLPTPTPGVGVSADTEPRVALAEIVAMAVVPGRRVPGLASSLSRDLVFAKPTAGGALDHSDSFPDSIDGSLFGWPSRGKWRCHVAVGIRTALSSLRCRSEQSVNRSRASCSVISQ